MQIVNLTPHSVTILAEDGRVVVLEPVSDPPRLPVARSANETIRVGGIPIATCTSRIDRNVVRLPARQPETLLIVSRMIAESFPERPDLVFPDDLVRDGHGQVIGCRRLARPG